MSTPSEFASEDAARAALVHAARQILTLGLSTGRAGNLSLRWHRGGADGLLITPSALAGDAITIDDIVWLPFDQAGCDVDAELPLHWHGRRAPSSEWRLHRDLLRAHVEGWVQPAAEADGARVAPIAAVVHVHSTYATTLACLRRIHDEGIPAFHYMIAVAGGTDIRCARYARFGSQALSDAAKLALHERRACLLAQHGQVALGASPALALELALEVETLARLYWQALQIGEPIRLDAAQMDEVLDRFSRYRSDAPAAGR